MSFRSFPAALVLIGVLLPTAGAEQPVADDASPKINYEDHIKPIFRQHCLSCHNQGESKGGLALDTHASLMSGGGSGEIVYDGDYEGSRLWQLITHEDTPVMPPGQDKIPEEQIKLIEAWIQGGLLENAGSKAAKKKTNSLAFVSSGGGRPEGPAAMPETVPQAVPVVTARAAAITAVAASPWAPLVAVAGQRQVVLYHSETAELLGVLPFPEGVPQSLRFSRDGAYLIVGGGEHAAAGLVAIYDVKTGERIAQVGDEYDVTFDADVNDDMTKVALGGPQKLLRIYSIDGDLLFDIKKHTDWIYAVAFSPDGVLVASGDRSAGLVVWEAETGRQFLDLAEHKGAVNAIAWRDDSNVFASASDDGTVKLWDIVAGKSLKSINAHEGGATGVAFDHEGRLITCGKDRKVKLWDAGGNLVREFPPMQEPVLAVAITHDGANVVAGDWQGQVLISKSEEPTAVQPLAANPPPADQRLKAQQEKLAAFEPEFQSSLAALDAAAAKLAEATQARETLVAKRDQLVTAAEAAEAAAAAALQRADGLAAEIKQRTATTRDQHDLVIAGRVGNLDTAEAQQQVADREAELAASLQQLAQMRRDQITARAEVASQQGEATRLQGEAQAMQEPLAQAEAVEAEAKSAHDAVAQQHAAVAARKQTLEQRIELLLQAVQ